MKKIQIILLVLLCCTINILPANDLVASLDDGRKVVLYENGTYEIIKADIPTTVTGFLVQNAPITFVDIVWDNITLKNIGNYLQSTSFMEKDRYTTGKFYLLSIDVTNPDSTPLEFDGWNDWENPVLRGNDGKTYKKISAMYAYLDDDMSYIGDMWDKPLSAGQTKTYFQIFEIPKDVSPIEIGVSSIYKKNIKWISLGEQITF